MCLVFLFVCFGLDLVLGVFVFWGFFWVLFWGGLGGFFFHFYTDAKALTLVGAEVYSTTSNREKSIYLCRHVYSSSQNVWLGAGTNRVPKVPFHHRATNWCLILSPASSTQTERIQHRSIPSVKYWWWVSLALWETTTFMCIWHTQELSILSLVEIPYVLRKNLKFFSMTPCHSHPQQDTIWFPVAWTAQLQAEGADSVNNKETDKSLAADKSGETWPKCWYHQDSQRPKKEFKEKQVSTTISFFKDTVKEQKNTQGCSAHFLSQEYS